MLGAVCAEAAEASSPAIRAASTKQRFINRSPPFQCEKKPRRELGSASCRTQVPEEIIPSIPHVFRAARSPGIVIGCKPRHRRTNGNGGDRSSGSDRRGESGRPFHGPVSRPPWRALAG